MQNKNILVVFTVLLAFATLYTLSFNWVASGFETTADEYGAYVADSLESAGALGDQTFDEAAAQAAREFLRDSATAEIYPVFGHSYRHVKEQELNLGLDLKGGMSVTLEVSLPDLIVALSDYSDNADFRGALSDAKALRKTTGDDFVTLFERAWTERAPEVELWRIFHNMENKDLFPAKSSDAEIFEILRAEAQTAIDNTESIIRKRIDQLGVAQPNVQKLQNGRILVELPGIDDRERARKQLKSTANLEFWETYFNDEVIGRLGAANEALAQVQSPELFGENAPADSTLTQDQLRAKNPLFSVFQLELGRRSAVVGYTLASDTNRVNDLLSQPAAREALGSDLRLLWEAKPATNVAQLFAIKDPSGKGKAELSGKSIVDARVSYDEIGDVVVSMTMNSEGAVAWGQMTERCANENNRAVAVVLDNLVFSAPNVQTAITNGRSQISFGSGQSAEDKLAEAEDLAGLLKAGSLPAPARIVDEVSVGPQLGEENINAGLSSFVIALLVVLAYMIFYYRGAGLVSNVALIANLFFLIGALASLGAALDPPRHRRHRVDHRHGGRRQRAHLRAHPRRNARWQRPHGRPERRLRESVQRHHRREHHHVAHRLCAVQLRKRRHPRIRHDVDHRHLHVALQRDRVDPSHLLLSPREQERHQLLHRSHQELVHQHRSQLHGQPSPFLRAERHCGDCRHRLPDHQGPQLRRGILRWHDVRRELRRRRRR